MPPSTADVRRFLTDYFSDEELTTLCFDFFPTVFNSFASGMSKGQKTQLLLEYVQRREQQSQLLGILQQQRPDQYARRFPPHSDPPGAEPPHPASPINDSRVPNPKPAADSSRALRIFLCHSSADKPAVRELYQRLRADGFEPWLDEEDLLPGQDWQREIPKAVRQSDVVIVCLSRRAISKEGYVQKEIRVALDVADEKLDDAVFLIPLKLEECDVPGRLARWQWVNHYDSSGYVKLTRSLRARASRLGLTAAIGTTPATPSLAPIPSSTVPNVIGVMNINAHSVSVGNDAIDPDKIIQTETNIEHVTVVQLDRTAIIQVLGGLEFVRIPAGKFLMGSKDDNLMATDDQMPQHTVEIPYDYWITRYPVTNNQFSVFVETTWYASQLENNRRRSDYLDRPVAHDHPVVNVSWYDAMTYCKWLNGQVRLPGLTVSLPTEAEWEKAARGEGGNEWPWGNEFDKNKCNSSEGGKGGTTSVGAYSPHGDGPYGVADMAGNVWEWCYSFYKPYPYLIDNDQEETDNKTRVLRGGAFSSHQGNVRAAARNAYVPSASFDRFGFRTVITPRSQLDAKWRLQSGG